MFTNFNNDKLDAANTYFDLEVLNLQNWKPYRYLNEP